MHATDEDAPLRFDRASVEACSTKVVVAPRIRANTLQTSHTPKHAPIRTPATQAPAATLRANLQVVRTNALHARTYRDAHPGCALYRSAEVEVETRSQSLSICSAELSHEKRCAQRTAPSESCCRRMLSSMSAAIRSASISMLPNG